MESKLEGVKYICLAKEELEVINKKFKTPNFFKEVLIKYNDYVGYDLRAEMTALTRDNHVYFLEIKSDWHDLFRAARFDSKIKEYVDANTGSPELHYSHLKEKVPGVTPEKILSPTLLVDMLHKTYQEAIQTKYKNLVSPIEDSMPELNVLSASNVLEGDIIQIATSKFYEEEGKHYCKILGYLDVNFHSLVTKLFLLSTSNLSELKRNFREFCMRKEDLSKNSREYKDFKKYGLQKLVLNICPKENYLALGKMNNKTLKEYIGFKTVLANSEEEHVKNGELTVTEYLDLQMVGLILDFKDFISTAEVLKDIMNEKDLFFNPINAETKES
jgi:hypothetical protein